MSCLCSQYMKTNDQRRGRFAGALAILPIHFSVYICLSQVFTVCPSTDVARLREV